MWSIDLHKQSIVRNVGIYRTRFMPIDYIGRHQHIDALCLQVASEGTIENKFFHSFGPSF